MAKIETNAKLIATIILRKNKRTQAEARKATKKTAREVRSMLYARTPRGETGGARSAFTNSPKAGVKAIYEINEAEYDATIGGSIPLEGGFELFDLLERGTRAHGPVKAKALHFFIDGKEIFARWVKGIRPMGIFLRTRRDVKKIWGANLKAAVRKGLGK